MKPRPFAFLAIITDDEQADYLKELYTYLWRFVRVAFPDAGGNLNDFVDAAIEKMEKERGE